jgi:hypothetical protein
MRTAQGWLLKFDEPIEHRTANNSGHYAKRFAYLAKTIPKSERDMPAVTTAAGDADLRRRARHCLDVHGAHQRHAGAVPQ